MSGIRKYISSERQKKTKKKSINKRKVKVKLGPSAETEKIP